MSAAIKNRVGRIAAALVFVACAVMTAAAEAAAPQPQKVEVSLVAPVPGTIYSASGSVTLAATASSSQPGHPVSKVEFYSGSTLIGTVTSAPYSMNWANVPAGSYSLTARAYTDKADKQEAKGKEPKDNDNATSIPVQIIVNAKPAVSLTSPTPNQVIPAPGSLTLTANATDSDGSIVKVEFYAGATLIGTATSAPYSIPWSAIPAGSYQLAAVATDNLSASTTSTPIALAVDSPPYVGVTTPSSGTVLVGPANVTLTATATDSDGTITQVVFLQNGTPIGTATVAPYNLTWNAVPGSYQLTAIATDNLGITSASTPVTLTVIANSAPTVTLTSPTPSQSIKAPATISLAAAASDADNNLVKVEFFQGSTLISTALAAPYTATWSNVPQGSYQISAIATDAFGAQSQSAPVMLTVSPAQASRLYFIHADHLGTPRLITTEAKQVVWRNLPTTEPFGTALPEEDPNTTGQPFEFNLRFPGQYFDRETNLHYNYFRDYDPGRGSYVQSDPIGLRGGLNTYAYVNGNPVSFVDPRGLTAGTAAGAGVILFCLRYPQLCVNGVRAASAAAGAACVAAANKIKNWMLNEGEDATAEATPTPPAPKPPETKATPREPPKPYGPEADRLRGQGFRPEGEIKPGESYLPSNVPGWVYSPGGSSAPGGGAFGSIP